MAQPFVGEIRMFAGSFAIVDWAFCNGALIPIDENPTLFNLIGTTYGGDGQNNFQLPDLQSRVPLHWGSNSIGNYVIGQNGGAETVTLTTNQIPVHSHGLACQTGPGTQTSPSNGVWASSSLNSYSNTTPNQAMAPSASGIAGSNQPHNNLMVYLCVNFIISLFGVYPSEN